ncbi:PDZ domain-containing protein [Pseudonocardia sp. N23]|uniref:YlbL family protein n=1 Tax=Pseudonocardia sp. N23 TaxID=1987376 RepID=UPI001558A27A|nr:S16 family serine protease [Pseudonocardia sp. N23]
MRLVLAVVGLLAVCVLAATVPVPLVTLGPGPTFNTLDDQDGKPVVDVTGLPTYATSGHLNMTTVSVTDGLTTFQVLRAWLDPDQQVVPRNAVFPAGQTQQQIDAKNDADFSGSETSAVSAALTYLDLPSQVVVGPDIAGLPVNPVLRPGDRIVSVQGKEIGRIGDIRAALAGTTPGQQIPVEIVRDDGPVQAVTVTLIQLGGGNTQGGLGIAPVARPAGDEKITISLTGVGGPSAGLMFSLAVVDRLTPGELTGGTFIAGTGEIAATGEVGAIAGIPLKLIAAKDAGATVFLVPAANCTEARESAPEGITLVKVERLTDAVSDLDTIRAGGTAPTC